MNIGCLHPACSERDFDHDRCPGCSDTTSGDKYDTRCNFMGHYSVKPNEPTTYYGTTGGGAPYC